MHANALGSQLERYPAAGGDPQRRDAADAALCKLVVGGSADLAQAVPRRSEAVVRAVARHIRSLSTKSSRRLLVGTVGSDVTILLHRVQKLESRDRQLILIGDHTLKSS